MDFPEVRVSNAMMLYDELSLGSSIWAHSHEEFRYSGWRMTIVGFSGWRELTVPSLELDVYHIETASDGWSKST